jgi:hypothetical protein
MAKKTAKRAGSYPGATREFASDSHKMAKKTAKRAAEETAVAVVEPAGYDWIHEKLWGMAVPIEECRLDPRNARRHTEDDLAATERALKKYKFIKPLARRPDGVIVIGNGRLTIARRLGWTHVPVIDVTGNEDDLTLLGLVDNRTGELAGWYGDRVNQLLEGRECGDFAPDMQGLLLSCEQNTANALRLASHVIEGCADDDEAAAGRGRSTSTGERRINYRIIISCHDDQQQQDLLTRFDAEGLAAKPANLG